MDTIIKTALVVAFVVVALLLPISNDGMLTRTMMNGERMGDRERGLNRLDVASYVVCLPTRRVALVGNLRKEAWSEAGPSEAMAT